MSERHYRIDLVAGVAMPETAPMPFDTGYAETETEHLAEVIQLPLRRRLFGFARALELELERDLEPEVRPTRFRTEVRFRRTFNDTFVAPAVALAPVPTTAVPAWRTELVFRRAPVEASVAPAEETADVADPMTVTEPSSIARPIVVAADDEHEHHDDADSASDDVADDVVEEEAVVVTEVEPEPAMAVAEELVFEEPKRRNLRTPKGPKPKRSRRGGGSSKGRRIVGLKVGASQLAAAVVENDGDPQVVQLARTPFEAGVVVDGEVRDEEALALALKDFFAQADLPTRDVRLGLSSNRIGVRTLDIAGIDDMERFDNAVRFKAHEVLPIAMNESVLDYRVLGDRVDENGEPVKRVLLVVAPRDQVDPYVSACQQAGVRLAGIDLEAFALLRTFVEPADPDAAEQAAVVVVSIGHESTTLVVSGAGVCEFTRVFGWGGAQLDAAIAAAAGVDGLEASAIKTQLSLEGDLPPGIDRGVSGKALEAVRTELTLFARELVSSLQFYQKQPDSLGIGEIVVTGGTSQLGGMADALHTLVGVPVRTGDPLGRVVAARGVASDPTLSDTLGSMSIAIGLGIEDDPVRAVNLLPSDVKSGGRKRPSRNQLLVPAAVIAPVAALAVMFVPAHSSVSNREAQLDTLKAELATLPEPSGPGIDSSIKGEQARRAAVVADVISRRTSWDRVFRDLSLVIPGDVWLTTVEGAVPQPMSIPVVPGVPGSTAPTPAPAATPVSSTGLRLSGETYNQAGVARLLTRLATVPTLTGVQLVSSTTVERNKKQVIQFQISASLRGAGEAS